MPNIPRKWIWLSIAALLVFIVAPLIAVTECPMPQTEAVLSPMQTEATAPGASNPDDIADTESTTPTVTVVLPVNSLLDVLVVRPGNCESVWAALLLAVTAGAVGGVIFELLSLHGNVELPHKYKQEESTANNGTNSNEFTLAPYAVAVHMYDLGIVARMLIGAMSALVVLLVVTPPDPVQLIAASIIAGSAGSSIFSLLRERLLATLAMNRAASVQMAAEQVQQTLAESESRLDGATEAYQQLRMIIDQLTAQPPTSVAEAAAADGQFIAVSPSNATKAKEFLQQMDAELMLARSALNKAQGISNSIRPPVPPEVVRADQI